MKRLGLVSVIVLVLSVFLVATASAEVDALGREVGKDSPAIEPPEIQQTTTPRLWFVGTAGDWIAIKLRNDVIKGGKYYDTTGMRTGKVYGGLRGGILGFELVIDRDPSGRGIAAYHRGDFLSTMNTEARNQTGDWVYSWTYVP